MNSNISKEINKEQRSVLIVAYNVTGSRAEVIHSTSTTIHPDDKACAIRLAYEIFVALMRVA